MITEWFLNAFEALLQMVIDGLNGVLPETVPDVSGVVSEISSWLGYAAWFNGYFPVVEVMAGWLLILAAFPAYALVQFFIWALTKVHILGGSST